jgi:hypothetical protein
MKQKVFLAAFAAVFSLLVCVQGYFLLVPDAGMELRADRIGASLIEPFLETEKAGEKIAGLSVYLTMETENDASSSAVLLVNGVEAGNFSKGVLCVKAEDKDRLALKQADGVTVTITDYPDDIDETYLPSSLKGEADTTFWGTVIFK